MKHIAGRHAYFCTDRVGLFVATAPSGTRPEVSLLVFADYRSCVDARTAKIVERAPFSCIGEPGLMRRPALSDANNHQTATLGRKGSSSPSPPSLLRPVRTVIPLSSLLLFSLLGASSALLSAETHIAGMPESRLPSCEPLMCVR